MAVELIGGAFLSASIQLFLERLSSSEVLDFSRERVSIEKLLGEFKTPMVLACKVLNDAEKKRICDPIVRRWLEALEEVVYVADDLLDEIRTEATARRQSRLEESTADGRSNNSFAARVRGFFPTIFDSFDREMEDKLRDIFGKIDRIVDQSRVLGLNEGLGSVPWLARIPPMAPEESCIYGRDSEKEFLVDFLVSSEEAATRNKTSVIPIVGMGGVGKTTLAQLVFNNDRVKEYFKEIRVWVTVSEEFDIFRLTNTVLEKVTSRKSDIQDPFRLDEVQDRLKEALKDKRFLLVLDDVWNEDYFRWVVLGGHLSPDQRVGARSS